MIGYTLDATRDLVRHQVRLASVSVKSAENFVARLALAEARIEARPRTYRLLNDRVTRRYSFKINRISYLIDYQIEQDQIVVLRIWHGRQERPH